MATPEEIAARYYSGSVAIVEEEDEDEIVVADEVVVEKVSPEEQAAKYYTPTAKVEAPVEEEQPGFLTRTLERLQLGASDAMSTLAGDTYGEYGPSIQQEDNTYIEGAIDPSMRTPLGAAARVQRAIGGDIAGSIGDVAADAIGTATPDIVKQGLSQSIAAIKENVSKHPIYKHADVPGEIGKVLDMIPERDRRSLGEAINLGAMFTPSKVRFAKDGDAKLAQSLRASEAKETQKILEPYNINDPNNLGKVVEEGRGNNQRYIPVESEARRYAAAESVPNWEPRRSARHNINALEAEVDIIKKQLDKDLFSLDSMPASKVIGDVEAAIDDIKTNNMLAGDAGTAAGRVYKEYQKILDGYIDAAGEISARDLLQSRRDLDGWAKKQAAGQKAYDAQTMNANGIALSKIREAVNDRVDAEIVDVDVKASLRRQSDLLTARDHLGPYSMKEAKTGLGRAVGKVTDDSGITPPRSPLALAANVSDATAMLMTGTVTLASLMGRGAVRAGKKITNQAKKLLDAAINAADSPAVLALLNSDESYE